MADVIELPPNLRITDRMDPHLSYNTRSGGQAINGLEQVGTPLSAVWRWQISIPIVNRADARSIRSIKSQLLGRFNYLMARVCDQYRISRADVGAWHPEPDVTYSDFAMHSDGTGFALAQPTAEVIAVARAGASTILIESIGLADAISVGVFISINDWLYQVEGWEMDAGQLTLNISPPLRQDITADDTVHFDARALWTLEKDDVDQFDLQAGKFGIVQLSLVEAIGRSM